MRVEELYPAENKNIREERSCSTVERLYWEAGRKSEDQSAFEMGKKKFITRIITNDQANKKKKKKISRDITFYKKPECLLVRTS